MSEQQAFEQIWDFMLMRQKLRRADMLLVLGGYDKRVPEWASELYRDGWAALVTVSGGGAHSDMTGNWKRPEAQAFADIMQEGGVPADNVLIEDRSNNTGENAHLSAELWKRRGLDPKVVMAVTQPYMERRAYATLRKWWPQREIVMTSPSVGLEQWLEHGGIARRSIQNAMVGDLWRLREYPAQGFQIEMEIPDKVWSAYEFLVAQGYGRVERPGPKTRPARS